MASLARIVGPAWGGYLYDRFGTVTPYVAAAALMMVAFVISLTSVSRTPERYRQAEMSDGQG